MGTVALNTVVTKCISSDENAAITAPYKLLFKAYISKLGFNYHPSHFDLAAGLPPDPQPPDATLAGKKCGQNEWNTVQEPRMLW